MRNTQRIHFIALTGLITTHSAFSAMNAADLIDIPLEELMQMDAVVNSVSKREEKLSDTSSAVFVISAEDIRRAGVTSIPEALRMAPGIQVGRIGSSSWGVSSRGLGGWFSRFLLILIDGRSIYASLFSGVNWEEQNVILENIDRIEVIRGPGGSVWGANAVNGVINIITKKAEDTQHTTFHAALGNGLEKHYLAATTGGKIKDSAYRFSIAQRKIGSLASDDGRLNDNDWDNQRVSFNLDRNTPSSKFSFDTEYSVINTNTLWPVYLPEAPYKIIHDGDEKKTQYYSQGKYKSDLTKTAHYTVRVSYDDTQRDLFLFEWNSQNTDLDIEYTQQFSKKYLFTTGINFRNRVSAFYNTNGFNGEVLPRKSDTNESSLFIQNQYSPNTLWQIVLAARLDDHNTTGSAFQPTFRAIYKPNKHRFWFAVSKAESTPSRFVNDESYLNYLSIPASPETFNLPVIVRFTNNAQPQDNAELTAYEFGYRYDHDDTFDLDLSFFHHDYQNLLNVNKDQFTNTLANNGNINYLITTLPFESTEEKTTQGIEASIHWQPSSDIHIQYSGSYIETEKPTEDPTLATFSVTDQVPNWQHSIRSLWDINSHFSFDSWVRYVDEYPQSTIKAYTSIDIRLEWRPSRNVKTSINGKNLGDSGHVEYQREIFAIEDLLIEDYWFIKVDWKL